MRGIDHDFHYSLDKAIHAIANNAVRDLIDRNKYYVVRVIQCCIVLSRRAVFVLIVI